MAALGFDGDAGDVERRLRDSVHEVAEEEVRPAGLEIDRMTDDDYREVGSSDVYWDALDAVEDVVPRGSFLPERFGGDGFGGGVFHTAMEELAWGSPGLAMSFAVDRMPVIFALLSFDDDLREEYVEPWLSGEGRHQGCWAVTEPERGSELLMTDSAASDGGAVGREPQATARREGDEYVVDGVKASWVSAGPAATHAVVHLDMQPSTGDYGRVAVVPLDLDGVSQGPPIDKLGQRDCPQGDIVLDDVRLPQRYMVMDSDMLDPSSGLVSVDQVLCFTSVCMAAVSTGLARAAFEEALAYAREREQAGKPIAEHQAVKLDLYEMFEKVETARAYSRRVAEHVWSRNFTEMEFTASHSHALAAQIYCKRTAFEVAHTAVQIHGGNGITRDYPVEKMFRDARVKLIEDGTLDVLGLEAADGVVDGYEIR